MAECLVDMSLELGSTDNISVIVVKFLEYFDHQPNLSIGNAAGVKNGHRGRSNSGDDSDYSTWTCAAGASGVSATAGAANKRVRSE